MATVRKRQPKVCDYYQNEDQFSPGIAMCPGCTMELNLRLVSRILGKDIVFVGTPGCSAPVLHGQNPAAWHRHAYYANVMTGVASSATGLARYYQKAGIDATVVCHTGDGCAQDVGFQTLSGAAERNEKVIYICYDNEGYMNTGVQQSSATPFGSATSTTPTGKESRGKSTGSKNMPMVMAMHECAYVATATLSHLEDYAKKLVKAKEKAKKASPTFTCSAPAPSVGDPAFAVHGDLPGSGAHQLLPTLGVRGRSLHHHATGEGSQAGGRAGGHDRQVQASARARDRGAAGAGG